MNASRAKCRIVNQTDNEEVSKILCFAVVLAVVGFVAAFAVLVVVKDV